MPHRILLAAALILLCACRPETSAGLHPSASGSAWIADPRRREAFKQLLEKNGVAYSVRYEGDREYVHYGKIDPLVLGQIQDEVADPRSRAAGGVAFSSTASRKEFEDWLKENFVSYTTFQDGDREYILWGKEVDALVRSKLRWPEGRPIRINCVPSNECASIHKT